jgi:hypothetical protein
MLARSDFENTGIPVLNGALVRVPESFGCSGQGAWDDLGAVTATTLIDHKSPPVSAVLVLAILCFTCVASLASLYF